VGARHDRREAWEETGDKSEIDMEGTREASKRKQGKQGETEQMLEERMSRKVRNLLAGCPAPHRLAMLACG